jgi:selenide,water dikinase
MLSAALKKGVLSSAGYDDMIRWTTQLNTPGMDLSAMQDVHAITDVTGFGLAGHLLEICRGSGLSACVEFDRVPCIPMAKELAQSGVATGASPRNWDGYGHEVHLPTGFADWKRHLLTDPQTSGGLLISCAPQAAEAVMALLHQQGFEQAAVVGNMQAGAPGLQVV